MFNKELVDDFKRETEQQSQEIQKYRILVGERRKGRKVRFRYNTKGLFDGCAVVPAWLQR